MAYNPYSAVNGVYKEKENWTKANQAGDINAQNMAAENAKKYYDELIKNGYEDVANELKASNLEQAKAINDKWTKYGKTATRDYLYTLGQGQGMSKEDVDNLIGWDDQTKEVVFGGKKIGRPDAIVDGVSYWSDASVLDNAFNDYISRSGTTKTDEQLIPQHNTEIQDKVNELWGIQKSDREVMSGKYDKLEDTAYSNPFTSEEARAILGKYDLAAMKGRDNAVASGGASNGGNIDSSAAANAMRQQAALLNMGQTAVLDVHNNKINNVKGILESLGIYQQNQDKGMQNTINLQQTESQRVFDNEQTAKNNEVKNQEAISGITGKVGDTVTKWLNENIWNADGSLKNYDENFQGEINVLRQLYNSTTDEGVRASYWERMRVLELARNQKIDDLKLNAEKTYEFQGAPLTADYELTNKQIDSAERIAKSGNETTLELADKEAASAVEQIQAQTAGEKEIIQESAKYDVPTSTNSTSSSSSTYTKNVNKAEIDATISHWLYSPWADFEESVEWKNGYSDGTHKTQYIAAEKMKDSETRSFVKECLVKGGFTEKEATDKMKEYEQNISIQIAKIEGKDYQDKDVIASIKERYGWV